ncbi:condensation domain-containing protein [Dactylosporangium sp. NPDC049140]|uniref:condensation domain-containing protein n=1 Tax=Dactylosporangium sp. NPDC049140 TaxID=3155647 RepID=UPI0033C8AB7D
MSEISVDFRGEGAGTAELTWGQMRVWRTSRQAGLTMNLVMTGPLPEGTSLAEMVAFLRFMVSRHPVLRSKLRFTDGPSGSRHPCQVIAESGTVPLQIADIDDEDPAATGEALRERYELTWFDHENEFPVRMGIVRQSDALRAITLGFSHVMVDGAALAVLTRDTELLDRATGTGAPPFPGLDLLELARVQRGPAGRRQTDRCMRYWEAQLGKLTSWHNDKPADPSEPRFRELVLYSPAMEIGLRAIAARTKAHNTHALLAAYALAVARVMGRNPSVAQIVVGNRFRPGFADAVLQLSQSGVCVVDAAAATFDEVVARAATAVTAASFHAYYDPVRHDELLDDIAARASRPLDISWHFNDRRTPLAEQDGGAASTGPDAEAALRDALPRTKLYWDRAQPAFNGSLFIQVDARPDVTLVDRLALVDDRPAVWLELWTDTHRFALDQIEALAREMEAVVVEAAFDAQAPTRLG